MPGGALDVVVRFVGDASKLNNEVDKVEGSSSKLKKGMAVVGGAVAGAFAVDQITDWIGAAEEANAASAKLSQVLGNAGDSTGEWAKHAEDLASHLQDTTAVDDEVIKGAQTILGTFHGVAGATGQTSGAFDRATAAALDLAKTGFGDPASAATMLGKALEDPEKGLTALGRAGVTFTDDQKAAIKTMVESGDKAGAMGAILDNVEGQVGGVAEKSATAGEKMKVAFGETQESLGQALLPVMNALAPLLQKVAGFIQENAGWLIPLAGAVAGVTAAVWLFNAALAANPIVLITLAIAALIAGLILAYQNVEWFRNAVDAMATFFVTAFEWIKTAVSTVFGWVADHWPLLLAILTGPIGIAAMLIMNNWDAIKNGFGAAVDFIRSVVSTVADIVSAPFQWAADRISEIVEGIKSGFSGAFDFLKNVWNGFARFWNGLELEIPGVELPGPIPDIPGVTVGLPDLPTLGKGGIVTGPTLALIGERGPEAVVPLDRYGGGGTTIVVNVATPGLGADAPAIQRAVVDAVRGYVRRNGPIAGIAS